MRDLFIDHVIRRDGGHTFLLEAALVVWGPDTKLMFYNPERDHCSGPLVNFQDALEGNEFITEDEAGLDEAYIPDVEVAALAQGFDNGNLHDFLDQLETVPEGTSCEGYAWFTDGSWWHLKNGEWHHYARPYLPDILEK